MSDDYLLDAAWEHWDMILSAYKLYEEHKPVVLFDIQEQRIYLYLYKDFKEEMNPWNQASLQDQYERAMATSKIVVFVRDNVNRRLVSYSGSSVFKCKTSRIGLSAPWPSGGCARSSSRSLATPDSSPGSIGPTDSSLTSVHRYAW